MKVRIVKCSKPDEWYAGKIGDILTVRDATAHFYAYEGQLRILKEDCEILESDEPKPEPFDLERALNGDKVITTWGRPVTELVKLNSVKGIDNIAAVIEGLIFLFSENGTTMYLKGEHLQMAPRETEYQTVWVNLYNESIGTGKSLHCSHAYIDKDEANRNLGAAGNPIGTFPITFKKP